MEPKYNECGMLLTPKKSCNTAYCRKVQGHEGNHMIHEGLLRIFFDCTGKKIDFKQVRPN